MIIVSSISPRAVATLPSESTVQCVQCKVYFCVWMQAHVYLCTAFGSLWFPLSLMSFVMFWSSECLLMGVICFLPLPCSLPASPTPILLYLHAVPPVPHLPPQLPCPLLVCSETAPSTEPAAHGWYLYFPPYVSLALSFFFNLYICLCSMPAFTVTQQTLLCQAAQPGNVSFVLCVRFMLAILICLTKEAGTSQAAFYINCSYAVKHILPVHTVSCSIGLKRRASAALAKWFHQLTNYSVSLKVPQRNITHTEARADYICSIRWCRVLGQK